ncbi:hypothetical protein [Pseudovibrio brasiliensis]|uniref:Uncharacterized protein n=1 Tax=Pseudovibrio brasiliensis TaxID=1898042 RepID=A0ABX8ALM0_9HYPH|nr:hypothetical protein [Pseudovibrio brasiliensis]QUS54601.1 hypothetical protein KGB56_14520 [Pseudovibrio brasiliensis]
MTEDTILEQTDHDANYERKVQSLSFLVPARRYDVNFDVTAQKAWPAILESALQLISKLEKLAPEELQAFYGLDAPEREGLIKEVLETGLIEFDTEGLLVATPLLVELRRNNQSMEMEEIVNYQQTMVVDNLTNSIQPRADDRPVRGLPELTLDGEEHAYEPDSLFVSQFDRFKQCSNNSKLRPFNTKLYRVNHCEYSQLTSIPISLDIYAHYDRPGGLRLESELSGFSENVSGLITTSGLHGRINSYLNEAKKEPVSLTLSQYATLVDDTVVGRYEVDGLLDLGRLLLDRSKKRTGYGNEQTRMVIGPLFMRENQANLFHWLSRVPNEEKLQRAFWLPSNSSIWGANVGLRDFTTKLDNRLKKHSSWLDVVVPVRDKSERYSYSEKFYSRLPRLIGFPEGKDLTELEILVIPGNEGWAMVQYHAQLSPICGMAGVSVPVGYCTHDKNRVQDIMDILKRQLGTDATKAAPVFGY